MKNQIIKIENLKDSKSDFENLKTSSWNSNEDEFYNIYLSELKDIQSDNQEILQLLQNCNYFQEILMDFAEQNQAQNQNQEIQNLKNFNKNNLELFLKMNSLNNLNSKIDVNLDKENMKISMDMPEDQNIKSINVYYDAEKNSIKAELITSQAAMKILQQQLDELEKNLAKHNIKLEKLKITAMKDSTQQEQKQGQSKNQKKDNE